MKQAKPGVLVVHLKVTPRSFSPVVYAHLYTSLEKGKLGLNVSYLSKVHETMRKPVSRLEETVFIVLFTVF